MDNSVATGGQHHWLRVARPLATHTHSTSGSVAVCGLMIVVDTPSVDNLRGFDEQVAAIAEGIRRTADLRTWFVAQGSVLRAWATLVAQAAGETGSSAKA